MMDLAIYVNAFMELICAAGSSPPPFGKAGNDQLMEMTRLALWKMCNQQGKPPPHPHPVNGQHLPPIPSPLPHELLAAAAVRERDALQRLQAASAAAAAAEEKHR